MTLYLKYRPIHSRDLAECLDCLRDDFAYDHAAKSHLRRFWEFGLADGGLRGLVMENELAPPGTKIYYFIIKAAITHEYFVDLMTSVGPLLGRRVLELWLQGLCPVLTGEQLRAANSASDLPRMTMVSLFGGSPAMADPSQERILGNKIIEWSTYSTSGYRIQTYLLEAYGEREWNWCEAAGFSVVRTYGPEFPECVMPGREPKLYGVTEADLVNSPGSLSSIMLYWQPPRFDFRDTEQELLLHAFNGDTDTELAVLLNIAPITVKKRWQSIYSKVELVDRSILVGPNEGQNELRGLEKKRRIIQYLRHHMEELRTYNPRDMS